MIKFLNLFFSQFSKTASLKLYKSARYLTQPKICVIGSGPSAFYTCQYLLKKNSSLCIDMYEKLPAPFGLIRYGVAPDHPDVKNVISTFTSVAQHPQYHYFGNINIGRDVSLIDLMKYYNAVIFAYGASVDRLMNIPGEEAPGVISAKDFVGWYNGYPKANFKPNLECEKVAIVGIGNVALDVARILLSPLDHLRTTDIPEAVLDVLSKSNIKKIFFISRRGPLHVSFTLKEFRELTKLTVKYSHDIKMLSMKFYPENVFNETIANNIDLEEFIDKLPRSKKRLIKFISEFSSQIKANIDLSEPNCEFLFLKSPLEIKSSQTSPYIDGIILGHNKLIGPPDLDQNVILDKNASREFLKCDLLVRSIGYKSIKIDPNLPFNDIKGHIDCDTITGRVNLSKKLEELRCPLYAVGWAKKGPRGTIAHAAVDAKQTAESVLFDLENFESLPSRPGSEYLLSICRDKLLKVMTFKDWEKIDMIEKKAGEQLGKPREKILTVQGMLNAVFVQIGKKRS